MKVGSRDSSTYIDSCAFWKKAYERLEVSHSDLLSQNHKLDRQIEQLRDDLSLSKAADTQAGVERKRSVKPTTNEGRLGNQASTTVKVMGAAKVDEPLSYAKKDFAAKEGSDGRKLLERKLALCSL